MNNEKDNVVGDNPLVKISELKADIVAYTGNEELGNLLDLVTRMISGNMPEPAKIGLVCSKLEAMAVVLRMEYVAYMGMYKGTKDANMKKNFAKEAYTGIDNLVAALKYMAK